MRNRLKSTVSDMVKKLTGFIRAHRWAQLVAGLLLVALIWGVWGLTHHSLTPQLTQREPATTTATESTPASSDLVDQAHDKAHEASERMDTLLSHELEPGTSVLSLIQDTYELENNPLSPVEDTLTVAIKTTGALTTKMSQTEVNKQISDLEEALTEWEETVWKMTNNVLDIAIGSKVTGYAKITEFLKPGKDKNNTPFPSQCGAYVNLVDKDPGLNTPGEKGAVERLEYFNTVESTLVDCVQNMEYEQFIQVPQDVDITVTGEN